MNGKSAVIVGAGISGLSVAISLAQLGARVVVLERAAELAEVGAGLQITPNGIAVIDALGLGSPLRDIGIQSNSVTLRDYRHGTLVAKLAMSQPNKCRPYLLLHRRDLISILADAAVANGVELRFATQVTGVPENDAGAQVQTADGETIGGDILIGADGLRSRIRGHLNGDQKPFFTGQIAWRATVPGAIFDQVQVFMGPGRHVVLYPLRGGSMTNVVAVEERDKSADEDWSQHGHAAEMQAAFADFAQPVHEVLSSVVQPNLWGLYRHPVAQIWHRGSMAILGDAAHPTLPYLAQGANMALEDAWILARCLAEGPMADALPRYQALRRARVERIVDAANKNARNYHLRNPAVRTVAHTGLRLVNAFASRALTAQFDWIYDYDATTVDTAEQHRRL